MLSKVEARELFSPNAQTYRDKTRLEVHAVNAINAGQDCERVAKFGLQTHALCIDYN